MRGVTLEELVEWVKKHEKHTWNHSAEFIKSSLRIKYLEFSLDTRDMKVWHVAANGSSGNEISIRDDNDGDHKTILDGLEFALKLK